jgi:hypothetical protein
MFLSGQQSPIWILRAWPFEKAPDHIILWVDVNENQGMLIWTTG